MVNKSRPRSSKTDLLPAEPKAAIIHRIILNKFLQIVFALAFFSILLPALCYIIFYSHEFDGNYDLSSRAQLCSHSEKHHIRCGVLNTSESECVQIGCCYSPISGCFYSFPAKYQYELADLREVNELVKAAALRPTNALTPFGTKSTSLNIVVRKHTVRQLVIDIGARVQVQDEPSVSIDPSQTVYDYTFDPRFFAIEVVEKSRNSIMLASSRGSLIADAHYFEWSFYLGSTKLYGLGEGAITERPFKKLLLRNGQAVNNFVPIVIAQTTKKSIDYFHALTFDCDAPMEFEIIKSSVVVVRGLSSEHVRLKLTVGTNYKDLLDELRKDSGFEKNILPYWAHGIHIYDNILRDGDSITTNIAQFLSTNKMPFDSHCIDERIMLNQIDQTDLMEASKLLKIAGKKIVLSVYSHNFKGNEVTNSELTFHLRNTTKQIYLGEVEDKTVAYVDWNNVLSSEWAKNVTNALNELNADGVFIQNNVFRDDSSNISRQLDENLYRNLPENFTAALQRLTPPSLMLSESDDRMIYFVNRWPLQFLNAVLKTRQNVKFAMASIYESGDSIAGASPGYPSTWAGLKMAMNGLLADATAGIRFSGSDVCGIDNVVDDEELCIQWYQLAAVMPVFRVHANKSLTRFSGLAQLHMIGAVELRYSLLSYINTIITTNEPVVRPMMYHFSSTDLTEVDQFLLGEDLMVVPTLAANQSYTERDIYFPDKYFDFRFGYAILDVGSTKYPIHISPLLIFVRAGRIVPVHQSRRTNSASESRLRPLTLIIAMNCWDKDYQICKANGRLAISKNQLWTFHANSTAVTMESSSSAEGLEILCGKMPEMSSKITKLRIYGLPQKLVFESEANLDLCQRGITNVSF